MHTKNIIINRKVISKYSFHCDPHLCVNANMCCCKNYDIYISHNEMQKIINCLDIIGKFCPDICEGNDYKNVFEKKNNRYTIDQADNDYCVFSYFDWKNKLRCGIHSAAYELNINPLSIKPLCCTIWPLSIRKENGINIIEIVEDDNYPCLKKTEKVNVIQPIFQNTIQFILRNQPGDIISG